MELCVEGKMASEIKQMFMQKLPVITKSTITRIRLPLSTGVKFPFSPFSSQMQLKWYCTQNTNQQKPEVDKKTNREANHRI